MIALTLALRNLWRNRRRSLATLLAVAFGFAAINLFAGYIHDVYRGLKMSAVQGEGLGHLIIAKKGFFEEGGANPARYQLKSAELASLLRVLKQDSNVSLATPRLQLSGLISNGKISTIFLADAQVAEDMATLKGALRNQAALDAQAPQSGLIAQGLARVLGLSPGQNAVLMTSTLEGSANALDLTMLDSFDTGNAATNDKLLVLPLAYGQQLIDSEGASKVVVLLKQEDRLEDTRTRLMAACQQAGLSVDIHSWEEESAFYRQVKNLFDLIFLFLFSIVFVVVLMSVINTLSMSVMERVREIGTLRAIGYTRGGIVRLFSVEGGVLGLVGCLMGALISISVASSLNAAHVQYIPPNSSSAVPLTVAIVPGMMLGLVGLLGLVSMLAALIPARRAAHIEIVDALGHV